MLVSICQAYGGLFRGIRLMITTWVGRCAGEASFESDEAKETWRLGVSVREHRARGASFCLGWH